jgi:uncharacterized membrane protein YkvA (DUF1232 family)
MIAGSRLGRWARTLKRDVVALWVAARDPRTPRAAKLLAGAVAAYALSPNDLIPDFIPILGYLDDLVVVPAGIWLALRMVPPDLILEFREEAARRTARPMSRAAAILVVAIWILLAAGATWLLFSP